MTALVAPAKKLLDITITAAVTGEVLGAAQQFDIGRIEALSLYSKFTYGSGGTTAKAWIQTSFDGGTTWMDIACFAATTASKTRAISLVNAAVTTAATPGDAALADDTGLNGFLGGLFRVKVTTTGTYAAGTTWELWAWAK